MHAAGVSNLIQQVCRLSKGLRLLNLSKTSLTSKGLGPSLISLFSVQCCVRKTYHTLQDGLQCKTVTYLNQMQISSFMQNCFYKAIADLAAVTAQVRLCCRFGNTTLRELQVVLLWKTLFLVLHDDLWHPVLPADTVPPVSVSPYHVASGDFKYYIAAGRYYVLLPIASTHTCCCRCGWIM